MIVVFEPKYTIGQSVCLSIAPERELVVTDITILEIDEAGQAQRLLYGVFDAEGTSYTYREQFLSELVEQH